MGICNLLIKMAGTNVSVSLNSECLVLLDTVFHDLQIVSLNTHITAHFGMFFSSSSSSSDADSLSDRLQSLKGKNNTVSIIIIIFSKT